MMANDGGAAQVARNIDRYMDGMHAGAARAADEMAKLLEAYAKLHHGRTLREAGFVYPGASVKRWREGGIGWGDVTGHTQHGTSGTWAWSSPNVIRIVLSANTPQAVFLELAREGRWAWLHDALVTNAGRLPDILRRHLANLGSLVTGGGAVRAGE
jgi:hypothetical protein